MVGRCAKGLIITTGTYTPAGYTVVVPRDCIGAGRTLSYRVEFNWNTAPGDALDPRHLPVDRRRR